MDPTQLVLCVKLVTHTDTFEAELDPAMTVAELRDAVQAYTDVSPRSQNLLYRGRQLLDSDATLASFGMAPTGDKIYVARSKPKIEGATLSPATIAEPKQPAMSAEATEAIVEALASNPDMVLSLMAQNPQTRGMLKNPDIARELRDPSVLRDLLRSSLDPTARAGLSRSMELRMAAISNMGGDAMLQSAFSDVLRPTSDEPDPHATQATDRNSKPVEGQQANNTPLPNPWANPIERLVGELRALGFTEQDDATLLRALQMTNGNVAMAAQILRQMMPRR